MRSLNLLWRCRSRALLALAGVLVVACIGSARAAEADMEAARLSATINEKLAALNLKQRAIELPRESAIYAREAIKQRRFLDAERIIRGTLEGSRLENWRFYP